MKHEFPKLYKQASVTLVEAGPRVLPMFHEKSSKHAQSELEEIGVTVKTNAAVDQMDKTEVQPKKWRSANWWNFLFGLQELLRIQLGLPLVKLIDQID